MVIYLQVFFLNLVDYLYVLIGCFSRGEITNFIDTYIETYLMNNMFIFVKEKTIMKKKTISLLFILIYFNLFSQETVLRIENTFKKQQPKSSYDEVLTIFNEKNKNLALFFIDKRKIYNYLFDENFNRIDSLYTEKRPRKYKNALGSSITNTNEYQVFLTNKSKNKFATIKFSFKDKTTTISELKLNLTNTSERFVQSISHQNKFYIITIQDYSNNLRIYSFDEKAKATEHLIDLSSFRVMNNDYGDKLSALFSFSSLNGLNININKFDDNSISSLEQTSDDVKMYVSNNKVILTFDMDNEYTLALTINLDTYIGVFKNFNKIYKFKAKTSNSYLFEDKLFQVASNSEKLFFIIRDFKSEEVLNQYVIDKNKPISFKNTPIIQSVKSYTNKIKLKNTKQFLRKILKSNIGISVDVIKNKYQITLGAIKKIRSNGGAMGMGFGIPNANFVSSSNFFNTTKIAYKAYRNTKSITIKTILDKNLKHVKGHVSKNAFDLLNEYQENYDNPKKGETIFKYKNYYIFGHFNYGNRFYQLHKFINE